MGTTYSIVCDTCRVQRYIDKRAIMEIDNLNVPDDEQLVVGFDQAVKEKNNYLFFRAVLVYDFMFEHRDHLVRIISEHESCAYKNDGNHFSELEENE